MGRYPKLDEDFQAVRLVLETGWPIARVARELGVNEGTLGACCAKARGERDGAPMTKGGRTDLERLCRLVQRAADAA
ncbi:MAG TPA: transposase [Actinomycetales bacterium]|jgi:transposase|nr:transposase [Actinomycetales bacterium]